MELILLLAVFVLMWAMFILPQQRRMRQHQAFVLSLEPGDEVVTAGGIIGTIVGVVEDQVILQVADGVELRLVRGAVSRRVDPAGGVEPLDATDADALEDLEERGLAPGPTEPSEPSDASDTWPMVDRDDDAGRERG